jgi:hypothetical protein
MVPIARPLRAPDRRAWMTLLFLSGVYAITVLTTPRWFTTYLLGTIFLTLALVWAPAGLSLLRTRGRVSRAMVAGGAAAILLLAVVLGRAQQVQYADQHYVNPLPFLGEGGPREAYEFTQKLHDKKIGIVGSSEIIFGQYGFYGNDATNTVEFIGEKGPHGANRLATSCPQLRRLIDEGEYEYVVMSQYSQDIGPYNAELRNPYQFPIYAWVKSDPGMKQLIAEPGIVPEPDYVFKVIGKLDPGACKPEKRPQASGELVEGL